MADSWWEAGTRGTEDALGYEPILLDLKASLRLAQRRFPEAFKLLAGAVELFLHGEHRDPHLATRKRPTSSRSSGTWLQRTGARWIISACAGWRAAWPPAWASTSEPASSSAASAKPSSMTGIPLKSPSCHPGPGGFPPGGGSHRRGPRPGGRDGGRLPRSRRPPRGPGRGPPLPGSRPPRSRHRRAGPRSRRFDQPGTSRRAAPELREGRGGASDDGRAPRPGASPPIPLSHRPPPNGRGGTIPSRHCPKGRR
jgi:hypothetical protein